MARRKNPAEDGDAIQGPDFEDSLAALEEIVAAMEEDQLPLEEVSRYEKGSKLLARCESRLRAAAASSYHPRDQDEIAWIPPQTDRIPAPPADEHDDDDDIRLF